MALLFTKSMWTWSKRFLGGGVLRFPADEALTWALAFSSQGADEAAAVDLLGASWYHEKGVRRGIQPVLPTWGELVMLLTTEPLGANIRCWLSAVKPSTHASLLWTCCTGSGAEQSSYHDTLDTCAKH